MFLRAKEPPGWVFKVENGRANAVLSSMMLIPANCITAAAQSYLLYSALLQPAEVAQCVFWLTSWTGHQPYRVATDLSAFFSTCFSYMLCKSV